MSAVQDNLSRGGAALLGALRAADGVFAPERLDGVRHPALIATLLLALTLALLAIFNLRQGFDIFNFVHADSLYPVQMLDFGLLEFRPPPPNRLFPDVALHWLAQPFLPDPLMQKLAVGAMLFAATLFFTAMVKGKLALALLAAILVSSGFEVLVSATHYSLPLLVLLYQAARGPWQVPVLFALTFVNPLVLLPLAFLLVDKDRASAHGWRALAVLAGLALSTLYSEFSVTIVQIVALFPFWYGGVWLARRLRLQHLAAAALCVLLPLAALAGLVHARYALPVAASVLVLMFPTRRAAFDWRALAFPVLAVAIFAATADWRRHDRLQAAYDCLAEELSSRNITVIAAGHWTATPLYFAAKKAGLTLTITQTDFARNISHPWMAPHDFYGERTHWAVRDDDTCALIDTSATYCGQASVAQVAESVPVCGVFNLYRYETMVPEHHVARPAGKIEAIGHNLMHYVGVVAARLR